LTGKKSVNEATPHNPFEAPKQETEYPGLPADTEFLVSDKCVLCEDEVVLPGVCIETGATTDLVRESAKLKYVPFLLGRLRWVMLLIVCPIVGNIVFQLSFRVGRPVGGSVSRLTTVSLVILVSLVAVTTLVWWMAAAMSRSVQVTWFTQRAIYEREHERRPRIAVGIYVSVCIVSLLAAHTWNWMMAGWILLPISGLLLVLWSSRPRNRPILVGRHENLNILKGLSPQFLTAVQEMIARHNTRSS